MKKILIALLFLSMIIIPSCSEQLTTEDILGMTTKVVYSDIGSIDPQRFDSYEELEAVCIKNYTEEAIHPDALVKFEVTDYGDICLNFSKYETTDERCLSRAVPVFSGYKGVIKEIVLKNAGNFPDETGKEVDILRSFFTVSNEKGEIITYFKQPYSFPLIKGEEYYAFVSIYEFEEKTYYCTDFTFMINDYREYKELEPYFEAFYESLDYSVLREGLLEKYEGMKFD